MDVERIADSFWFVLLAYVAAFAPWTIISEKDFISEKWRTVKHTRNAAYHNLFWSSIPFLYVVAYCVIQALAKDYKETCAALIASLFALRHTFRTLWGLWQLNSFRSWAKTSILALKAIGIAYRLPGMRHKKQKKRLFDEPLTAAYVADHILVNEKIIDNQIMHGHLHSFLAYGDINLLTHADDRIHILDPVYGAMQWFRIAFSFLYDQCIRTLGHRRRRSLRQVPLKPVEVWVHWAAAFAAQGLKDWLSEFDVVPDPDAQPYDHSLTAIDKLRQRGRYFSTQVLASATLQLWPDYEYGQGSGPFLWDAWPTDSQMSDGRVVKQELFELAIRSGEALPFRVPHLKDLKGLEEYDDLIPYGYDAYRDVLTEFIAELPVKCIHVREIRDFDINKLEWLTILIYIGMLSRQYDAKQRARRRSCESSSCSSSDDHSSSSGSSSSDSSVAANFEPTTYDVDSDQAVATLRAQLNIPDQRESRNRPSRKQVYITDNGVLRSAFPVGMNLISLPATKNRLITKVGELIDVWMALIAGCQISFLLEELNEEWKTFCLVPDKMELCEIGQPPIQSFTRRIQKVNYELEKRRLTRRIADKNHKYKYMDQFVTFMGYRMESVRSFIARWVHRNEGKSGDDFFARASGTDFRELSLSVHLSPAILTVMESRQCDKALDRRCVQCRLIWELQNFLESILMPDSQPGRDCMFTEDDAYLATITLFVLSFPSLHISSADNRSDVEQSKSEKESLNPMLQKTGNIRSMDDGQVHSQLVITPICGPQRISILLKFRTPDECTIEVLSECKEFHWRWWRDAFLGRLEGFRDWQKELKLSFVDVDHISDRQQVSGTVRLQTTTKSSFWTWNEWPPFRAVICRYELESEGLLRQPCVVGQRTPEIRDDKAGIMSHVVELPIKRVQAVSYNEADDAVLMHTCLLVQDAVRDYYNRSSSASSVGHKGNDVDLMMTLASSLNPSRASTLYEMAALQYGRADALMKCMEVLFDFGENSEDYYRGLDILRSFVATMLPPPKLSLEVADEDEIKFQEYVLPACEKVLLSEGDKGYIYRPLMDILNAYLICDPQKHHSRAFLAMQQLLFITQTNRTPLRAFCDIAQAISCVESSSSGNESICCLLGVEAERFSAENGRTRLALLELAVSRGDIHLQSRGLSKKILKEQAGYEDIRKTCVATKQEKLAIEELGYVRSIYSLAVLLDAGTNGVKKNVRRAAELYERLILEWDDAYAMFNLALLLEKGGEGLQPDIERSVELYKRAIAEDNNVEAMFSLALLRHYGAPGLDSNLQEAITMYKQAIGKENHVGAMYNLATLLQTGADGVDPDPRTAMSLYERVLRTRNHVHAKYNLAVLLQSQANGLQPNLARAVELFESLAEEGDVNAMYALAVLMLTGHGGLVLNVAQAKAYIRKAVTCESSVTVGIEHMQTVWNMMKTGSEQIEKDIELCTAIETHARQSGVALF